MSDFLSHLLIICCALGSSSCPGSIYFGAWVSLQALPDLSLSGKVAQDKKPKKKGGARRKNWSPSDYVIHVNFKEEDFPPLSSPSVSRTLGDYDTDSGQVGDSSEAHKSLSPVTLAKGSHTHEKTYAASVKENRANIHGIKLCSKVIQGDKIPMDDEDYEDIEKTWGYGLIGYVGGRSPGIQAIKKCMEDWKVDSKLHMHPSGWMVFKFKSHDDRVSVLSGGSYTIHNRPLLLKTMPLDFDFGDEEISKCPIWIQLPNLPLSLWTKCALSKIGSKIGTPITTDLLTQNRGRIAYARLLVEVDVHQENTPLPENVTMVLRNGKEHVQRVKYEYIPYYCKSCKLIGHDWGHCGYNSEKIVPKTSSGTKNGEENGLNEEKMCSDEKNDEENAQKQPGEVAGGPPVKSGSKYVWEEVRRNKRPSTGAGGDGLAGEDDLRTELTGQQPPSVDDLGQTLGEGHAIFGNGDGDGLELGGQALLFSANVAVPLQSRAGLSSLGTADGDVDADARPPCPNQSPLDVKAAQRSNNPNFFKSDGGPTILNGENIHSGQGINDQVGQFIFGPQIEGSSTNVQPSGHVGLPSGHDGRPNGRCARSPSPGVRPTAQAAVQPPLTNMPSFRCAILAMPVQTPIVMTP